MSISALRDSIAATRDVIYLNTGWAGPSPEPVLTRMREVFELEASAGPASLQSIQLAHDVADETRAAVAALLHADTDDIALTHGTTEGVNVVLYGYPWQPGDELVTCNLEHPALSVPPTVLEARHGVVTTRVDVPPDAADNEQMGLIAAAMRPRTRVVALSHVQFSCGLRMPIRAIAEVVHRAGALLLVDGAQGAGQMAVDVHSLEVDFYAISGQKWLLGPQGTGALYVAREHARIVHPLFTTHALADEQAALAEAAGPLHPLQRFRVASQSTGLVAGFGEAVRLMQSLGFDTIEERANELAGRLRAGLAVTAGCTLIGPRGGSAACALVAVSLDGWKPPSVVEALWGRWRIAARAVVFPPAVRFSTHVFNTEAEIDATLEAVGILAKEGPPREPGPT